MGTALQSDNRSAVSIQQLRSIGCEDRYFLNHVREIIAEDLENVPSLNRAASKLCMSSRTFSRRLERHGYGYRKVCNEVRKQRAVNWLRHTDMPITLIAKMVGYSDGSNFVKAFRLWTGLAPREYRKVHSNFNVEAGG